MVTIMKSIKEFTEEFESKIRNEQKDANLYKTEYVTIDKDGIIKISSLPYYLETADICILICHYHYIVVSASDWSCFVQFINKDGFSEPNYFMNDWTLRFIDEPHTSLYRTYNHRFWHVSNGEIEVRGEFSVNNMAKDIKRFWPYFLKMQKAKTQEELNLLGECFQKDIDINNISEQLLKEKQAKLILEEQVNAYKFILDKIENLVANA